MLCFWLNQYRMSLESQRYSLSVPQDANFKKTKIFYPSINKHEFILVTYWFNKNIFKVAG